MSTFQTPVLLKEVVAALDVRPGKKYLDATLGGGGHAAEIAKRGGRVLGIDADPEALTEVGDKVKAVLGNFRDIEHIAKENGFDQVDGVLFDLGVSSHQLDTPGRGFSYRFAEAAIDLRFDQGRGKPAAELIKRWSQDELYEIFARFGEEPRARAIALALVHARRLAPINKIGDLVKVVESAVPKQEQNATLSRIFQALRIAVNAELSALSQGLSGAERLLVPGGRLAVISFQSLEDRIVKQFMRRSFWKVLTKKPIVPTAAEIAANSRARSAKLRIGQKL